MKIYDYGKTKNCLICGNVDGNINKFIKIVINNLHNLRSYVTETHPKEIERQERLAKKREEMARHFGNLDLGDMPRYNPRPMRPKKMSSVKGCNYNLTETVIIVNGFNNFGEKELKYYYDKLEMFNKVLADNNTHILFIRGNDDPKYFENELINLSNIKTIQDYSVVKLNKFNCLCIGGCVSIDRKWKMEQEKRIGRKMYWESEALQYKEEDIDNIINNYNIACVVTASCPSFAYPGMNSLKQSTWASKDKNIIKEITEERMIMDKIYNKIVEKNKKPYIWVYGRFRCGNQTMINDILFQSLSPFQFFHFNNTVSNVFNVDLSKALKENECVAESFGGKIKSAFSLDYNEPEDMVNPFVDDNEEMGDIVGEEMPDETENNGTDNDMEEPRIWNPINYGYAINNMVARNATEDAVTIDHANIIRPIDATYDVGRLRAAYEEIASLYINNNGEGHA